MDGSCNRGACVKGYIGIRCNKLSPLAQAQKASVKEFAGEAIFSGFTITFVIMSCLGLGMLSFMVYKHRKNKERNGKQVSQSHQSDKSHNEMNINPIAKPLSTSKDVVIKDFKNSVSNEINRIVKTRTPINKIGRYSVPVIHTSVVNSKAPTRDLSPLFSLSK